MTTDYIASIEVLRPKAQAPIYALEAGDQLLKDCKFIGTGCHSETMESVRLYVHTPTGETLWV